jgi:hypothetical protein
VADASLNYSNNKNVENINININSDSEAFASSLKRDYLLQALERDCSEFGSTFISGRIGALKRQLNSN